MEEKRKKITFNKAGKTATNNRGMQYVLGVPTKWVQKIGISPDDRDIVIYFDDIKTEIIISKNDIPDAGAEKMEKRDRKISVKAAGGNAGLRSVAYLLSLPKMWIETTGITPDDRDVIITLDEENGKITMRKGMP